MITSTATQLASPPNSCRQVNRFMSVRLSLDHGVYRLRFGAYVIEDLFCEQFSAHLLRAGWYPVWRQHGEDAALRLRLDAALGGSRLLRCLTRNRGAVAFRMEGELLLRGRDSYRFNFGRTARGGMLGGSARCLIEPCVRHVAADIARFVCWQTRQAEKPGDGRSRASSSATFRAAAAV